jgi:hypothetical protein
LRAGLPTPTEDEELRREYQMKRLVAAMSQGERAEPGDLDALLLEWLALGPAAAADYDSLRRRFERCWVAER